MPISPSSSNLSADCWESVWPAVMHDKDLSCITIAKLRSAEQFTDNETSVDKTQLTEHITMEEKEKLVLKVPLPTGDPYPDKTPRSMLTRQYLIKTANLQNAAFTRFFPHKLLFEIPTIKEYLSRFRYFRASIKLHFLMVSTPMQYGVVSVNFLPYTKSNTQWTTLTQRSQANMHLLDISQQESLEITLPYLSPKLYWDTTDFNDPSWAVDVGTLAMNTVTSTTTYTAILKVFASFVEPECAGYIPEPVAQFQSALGQVDRRSRLSQFAGVSAGHIGTLATTGAGWLSNLVTNNPTTTAAAAAFSIPQAMNFMYSTAKTVGEIKKATVKTQTEQPAVPSKLELCPDLSAPSGGTSLALLGDSAPKHFSCLPTLNNIYDINQICQIPTYHSRVTINNTDPHDIPCTPFSNDSYAKYFKPMFKYFRGSSRIFIRFATAPSVSGRIKLTLFPVSPTGSNAHTEGDLPSWILTVKGPTSWALEVPYLQLTPWVDPVDATVSFPTIRMQLLDYLPQPFDRTVSIFAMVFVSGGSDFQFAGLQSFVPSKTVSPPPGEATFQCSVLGEMTSVLERIGDTFDFPYQGGLMNVHDIVSRYSSRDANPEFLFPFPIKIQDWIEAYKLDNYDYIANLYKFYTGESNVRMLFSKGATSSLLRAGVSNSNTSLTGREWKSSNSIAVTDQTIWPLLEFKYPYLNTQEFDSIWEPNGMFAQQVDNTAELDTYFLSASENFRLMYLLPVPDFFTEVQPQQLEIQVSPSATTTGDSKAIFQSSNIPRYIGDRILSGRIAFAGNGATTTTVISNHNYDRTCYIDFEFTVERSSGTSDFIANIGLTRENSPVPTPPTPGNYNNWPYALLGGVVSWKDIYGNGKNVINRKYGGAFSSYGTGGPGPINISIATDPGSVGVTAVLHWRIRISPWKSFVALTSPQRTDDTVGLVDANIYSSTVTHSVFVTNNPTVTVDGVIAVEGSSESTVPVWTTAYKP